MNKYSTYNYLHNNGKNFILFNCASRAYLVLVPQLAKLIDDNKDNIDVVADIHPELFQALKDKGFVVDKDLDEVEALLKSWREAESSPKAYSITVLPTLDCNCRCWYCYEQHNAGTNMSPHTVELTKKHIGLKTSSKELERFHLSFFGGEPLMGFHNVVTPLIAYAKEKCQDRNVRFSVSFTTNASLLTDAMIGELVAFDVPTSFQITLDGNRKTHDGIRCTKTGKPTFDTIVGNVHKLLAKNFRVSLRINYTAANLDTNYDVIDEFKDLSDEMRKLLTIDFQQVWQDRGSKSKFGDNAMDRLQHQFKDKGLCIKSHLAKKTHCYADCENSIILNYNGDVYKCTARDFNTQNKEGQLEDDGNVEFNDNYTKRMSMKHSNRGCYTCKAFPVCLGPCSQFLYENGSQDGCPSNYTEEDILVMVKESLQDSINKYKINY